MKTIFSLLSFFLLARAGLAQLSTTGMEADILPLADADFLRDLKGGKSSKSKGGDGAGCIVAPPSGTIVVKQKQIAKNTFTSGVLTSWEAPFREKKGSKTSGTAYFTQIETDDKKCIQNIILQFNKNTHLAMATACKQRIAAIVGGTGKYPCAEGQAKITSDKKTLSFDINKITCNC